MRMRIIFLTAIIAILLCISGSFFIQNRISAANAPIIIVHRNTNLRKIPRQWIVNAKNTLHIAYGHTSHGSQITTGMTGLASFAGNLYAWNNGGAGGALDLKDGNLGSASELGNPNRIAWESAPYSAKWGIHFAQGSPRCSGLSGAARPMSFQ